MNEPTRMKINQLLDCDFSLYEYKYESLEIVDF